HLDAPTLGFAFAPTDPRERRVGKHAVGDQPASSGAITTGQVVADDAEIVERDVVELRTPGALANRPYIGRARLEPVIDRDISATVDCDAREFKSDPGSIWGASCRDQDVAALNGLLASDRPNLQAHAIPGPAPDTKEFGAEMHLDPFVPEHFQDGRRHVKIFAAKELR